VQNDGQDENKNSEIKSLDFIKFKVFKERWTIKKGGEWQGA